MKTIRVFDLDGCLADSSHRYALGNDGKIDLQHWRDNSHKVLQDAPLPLCKRYIEGMKDPDVYTIIATARVWCENSTKWVLRHLGQPDKLVHRQGNDDMRGGAALKIEAIKPMLNLRQFKDVQVEVYEDNHTYLRDLCHALNARGFYIPSPQGH